jgi:catechol 2,3-dioxygenase-like lactoylglutathione lyase family enzyme
MNQLLKIDNIMYKVKDLEKSAKFYEEVLGLKRTWTDKKRLMVGFCFAESDSEIVITSDTEMPNFDLVYLVKNVEEFCDEYIKAGYKIKKKPFDVRCGKYAVVEDLDHNSLPIIDLTAFGGVPQYGDS